MRKIIMFAAAIELLAVSGLVVHIVRASSGAAMSEGIAQVSAESMAQRGSGNLGNIGNFDKTGII